MARKQIIESPQEMRKRTDAYFASCAKNELPPTLTGLVRSLGFASRQSLTNYSKKHEFSEAVAYARLRIEEIYEQRLHGTNPTGAIFALKNMGWTDKQALEHSGHTNHGVVILPADMPLEDYVKNAVQEAPAS